MNSNISQHFICPISNKIMIEPVICQDGNTYDKSSILNIDNPINPFTKQTIDKSTIIPNNAIKQLIVDYFRILKK
jgi:hypothetical protein